MTEDERELWQRLGLSHAVAVAEREANDGMTGPERETLALWRRLGMTHVGPADVRAALYDAAGDDVTWKED